HEANARAGLANKVGAKFAAAVAAAVPGSGLSGAKVIGIPLRHSITTLDRAALRAQARQFFGLHPTAPVLLVVGGSQGARSINDAVSAAAPQLGQAGIGVLHAHGPKNTVAVQQVPGAPAYVPVPYLERMDLAYAAADAVLCRSGAMTVAEVSALGLPAMYVPLPHGNGEQALNANPVVDAGGGLIIPDAELSAHRIVDQVLPILRDGERLAKMGAAAQTAGGHREADMVLARMVLDQVRR
ncbi:UDP-N-acetylglucosamine--N-acetylmuramyl-(pentapeptide) pyrophosphoryl-undecaprenol N-acetylglucosamine transferase, partial [Crossiella equi]